MNITDDLQYLLALIQTQAQLIAMIQTHQALLDQVGYTGTNNVSASTSNVNMATLTLSAYHIGLTQPLVCYTSPSSFSQPTYGPKQFHQPHQIAAHTLSSQSGSFHQSGPNQFVSPPAQQPTSGQNNSSVGQPGSNPVRHETLMSNAFRAMMLQDLTTGNWNINTGASSHLNDFISSLSDALNMCIYPSVLVGGGYSIPVTNTGHSIFPTPHRPLHFNNVLITPNIVKKINLCPSVCS
ncbi:hypothetical protein Tco_1064907 [Tanacetum coccineum]